MNALERRVTDALRAYADGLTMTTHDIDRIERELEDQRHAADDAARGARRRLRGRIFQGAVAACAVTGVVLGALALRSPTPTTPTTPAVPTPSASITLDDLVGTWRLDDNYGWVWQFFPSGRLNVSGEAASIFDDEGTAVTAQGSTFTLRGEGCTVTFTANIGADGRMRATPTSTAGECDFSVGGPDVILTRLSPRSPAGEALVSKAPVERAAPVRSEAALHGSWLLRGTGVVAVFDAPDTFALDHSGLRDDPRRGTVAFAANGAVTLTLDEDRACTLVWTSAVSTRAELTTTTSNTSCSTFLPQGGLLPNPQTWVRLTE